MCKSRIHKDTATLADLDIPGGYVFSGWQRLQCWIWVNALEKQNAELGAAYPWGRS